MLDGPERRIVIMDFGIAKTTDSESPSLTATGATIGSPRYMSPEQALGEMPIDHLSDQYSLALVGYRMLAGRLPFDGDSARQILLQKATRAPTPVRELRPDVPSTLARIIERALSKEREARFPSMAEFGSALAGVVAEVTGEFRQRRVVAPMADRWSIARASLYDRPLRYVSVAAMALAAFVVAYPRAGSSAARSAAGARDTVLSATRAIMAELGAPGDYAERTQFIARETEHRYIQSALSADSAERVAKQLPIWIWDVTRYRRDPLDAWRIEANGAGRIMAFNHLLPDTARRPMIAQDSALSIAERALERLGWRLTDLRLVRHSTPTEANRVQENFVWTVAGSTIHRARDSAYTQLSLTLAGPEPVAYRQSLRLPDGYVPNMRPQTIQALASIGMTGLLVLVIIAVITTMLRSAHDVLQWGLGVRMGAIAGALWVLSVTLPRLRGVTVPYSPDDVSRVARGLNYVLASMLNVSMMGSVLVVAFLFVAAESLLNEGRPDLLAGINDLSRGRLAIPEVVGALPAGYAYGFVAAAFLAVVQLIQRNVFDVPVETELVNNAGAFANAVPALGLLEPLRIAIVAIAVVMFVIALALQWRRPWIAPIAVSLLWYCVRFGPSESSPAHVAAEAVVLGAVTWLAWERGALVALMVMFLAVAVPVVADFLWARGPFVSSGIVGLIAVAAPAAFGAVVYRRRSSATRKVGVRVR
jgi:serine/threonine-protein kinase